MIIPAYRAQETLPRVMDAVQPQVAGPNREVVLVDSSGDNGALAQEWPWAVSRSLAHRILPGQARNLGASIGRGELLAFLDADTVPQPGWLDELERAMTSGIEMVAGAILDGTPDDPWGTVGYMLEFLEWTPERATPVPHAASCNVLIRRSAFEQAGGFPEDLFPGEDTVFSVPFADRGTLAFAPHAQVTHLNRVEPAAVLAHQRRLGASWVQVCDRVSLRGGWLAVPCLAPLAVLGRLLAIIRQLRRTRSSRGSVVRHGPRLIAGLIAWGFGILRPA